MNGERREVLWTSLVSVHFEHEHLEGQKRGRSVQVPLCAWYIFLDEWLQSAQSCRKPYLNVWPSHTYSYVGIPVWNVVDHQFLFYDDLHVMVAFTLTHVDGLSIYGFNGAPDHMGMSLLHSPP